MFAAAVGLLTAAAGRFMLPNAAAESTERFRAGRPDELPPGYVETKYKQRHGAWLVHGTYDGQQQIYALSTRCTHLGCITIWQDTEQKFACPCHGSGFNKLGENIEGPAPRPLERFAIRLAADGQLEVDTSHVFREDLGQWTDPACFVVTG